MVNVRTLQTADLRPGELAAMRALCDAAWAERAADFSDDDWQAAIGGTHVVVEDAGTIVAHSSLVERTLELDGTPLRTGYVEAVATLPAWQRQGLGTLVMREVSAVLDRAYELGALSSALDGFYERFGWQIWPGTTGVREGGIVRPTPKEDGAIYLRFADGPRALHAGLLVCGALRPGDPW